MESYRQEGPESLEHQGGTRHNGNISARPATPHREAATKREKVSVYVSAPYVYTVVQK